MTTRLPRTRMPCLGALLLASLFAPAAPADPAGDGMAAAGHALLASLTPEQRAKAVFVFKDDERLNWHFIPRERKGLSLKEMNPAQRHLTSALLASGLSARGLITATTIMSLEDILAGLEKGQGPKRDSELYFVTFFGEPAPGATWGWRFEGHHLALNFTVVKGAAAAGAPSMFGSNPAEVKQGPRAGLRALGPEEDLGRALMKSLSPEQRAKALIADTAPKDIFTAAEKRVQPLPDLGVPAAELTPDQAAALRRLVEEYARRCRPELADAELQVIEAAGFGKLRFAWAGGLEPGEGHYYRVQGPTFVLEYDNVQNNNNHIHAVWRDFDGDFGEDLLRKHYSEVPH